MTAKKDWEHEFSNLFAEAKVHAKKNKTLGESRKARVRKTTQNIMKMRLQINEEIDKLASGSMTRYCIAALVTNERCALCGDEHERVDHMEVWSKSTARGTDKREITARVLTKGMYEFHQDLPIKIRRNHKYIPACASCLTKDMEERANGS